MKVCIYGAGAIGGLLGARLAAAGHSVSVVARGESMEAIQRQGLGLVVALAAAALARIRAVRD